MSCQIMNQNSYEYMLYKVLFESWFSLAFSVAFNIIRIFDVEVQLCIKNSVGKITPFCIYRALSC